MYLPYVALLLLAYSSFAHLPLHTLFTPVPSKKIITFVFHFSWILQLSKGKIFLGEWVGGKQDVLWEMCKWRIRKLPKHFGPEEYLN